MFYLVLTKRAIDTTLYCRCSLLFLRHRQSRKESLQMDIKKRHQSQHVTRYPLWIIKVILILVFLQIVKGQNPHDAIMLLQILLPCALLTKTDIP